MRALQPPSSGARTAHGAVPAPLPTWTRAAARRRSLVVRGRPTLAASGAPAARCVLTRPPPAAPSCNACLTWCSAHPAHPPAVEAPTIAPAPPAGRPADAAAPAPGATPAPAAADAFAWQPQWYPAAAVECLKGDRPQPLQLLGQRCVVFKGAAESLTDWIVLEDVCPHRLAPLSDGRLTASRELMCSYQ